MIEPILVTISMLAWSQCIILQVTPVKVKIQSTGLVFFSTDPHKTDTQPDLEGSDADNNVFVIERLHHDLEVLGEHLEQPGQGLPADSRTDDEHYTLLAVYQVRPWHTENEVRPAILPNGKEAHQDLVLAALTAWQ